MKSSQIQISQNDTISSSTKKKTPNPTANPQLTSSFSSKLIARVKSCCVILSVQCVSFTKFPQFSRKRTRGCHRTHSFPLLGSFHRNEHDFNLQIFIDSFYTAHKRTQFCCSEWNSVCMCVRGVACFPCFPGETPGKIIPTPLLLAQGFR